MDFAVSKTSTSTALITFADVKFKMIAMKQEIMSHIMIIK